MSPDDGAVVDEGIDGKPRDADIAKPRSSVAVLAVIAAAAVSILAGVVVLSSAGAGETKGASPLKPLNLATVSEPVAAHYRFAAANQELFAQIPCYCGCERAFGHRSLYDCFIRADGRGFEAHASGCGVCVGEAKAAQELSKEGRDAASIRAEIIERFSKTPATFPTEADS